MQTLLTATPEVGDQRDEPPFAAIADEASFDECFREFYPVLVGFAVRITRSDQSAKDVVQDVFLKLWRDRDKIYVKVSLQALLYTMTRNLALNSIRNRDRLADGDASEIYATQFADEPDPLESLHADSMTTRMNRWIDELPERRREAFILSRLHGLSHAEIASIMNVGKRTIDTHILLALRELRRHVDEFESND